MINTIIKEEDDEEEKNISEKDLSNPNTNILKSIKSESILEESKYNQLNNGEPNLNKIEKYSDNSLSQYTEDILPKIYSKHNKYREVNKTKTLILSSNLNLNEKDEEKRTILHRACLQLKNTSSCMFAIKIINNQRPYTKINTKICQSIR